MAVGAELAPQGLSSQGQSGVSVWRVLSIDAAGQRRLLFSPPPRLGEHAGLEPRPGRRGVSCGVGCLSARGLLRSRPRSFLLQFVPRPWGALAFAHAWAFWGAVGPSWRWGRVLVADGLKLRVPSGGQQRGEGMGGSHVTFRAGPRRRNLQADRRVADMALIREQVPCGAGQVGRVPRQRDLSFRGGPASPCPLSLSDPP